MSEVTNDLISKQAAIDRIKNHLDYCIADIKDGPLKDGYILAHEQLIEVIEIMAIAYDVDAVVEQLEAYGRNIELEDEVFDIVRKGGKE